LLIFQSENNYDNQKQNNYKYTQPDPHLEGCSNVTETTVCTTTAVYPFLDYGLLPKLIFRSARFFNVTSATDGDMLTKYSLSGQSIF